MVNHVPLRKGDDDKSKKWGAKVLAEAPPYTVTDLQNDLEAVGIYTYKLDGEFGAKTEKTLKIFQWVCANMEASIKNGVQAVRVKKGSIILNGILEKATHDELTTWVKAKQVVTGDLVRIPFSSFSDVEAGSGFKKIDAPGVAKGDVVISKSAVGLLKEMYKQAKDNKLKIKVNQAFRIHGSKVAGAVVTPATKSQHLIGHAVDCNIVDGSNWNSSATFRKQKESEGAKNFIKAMKAAGYRWGGNFVKVDTPHFDKQVVSTNFEYDARFFLNQRMISEKQAVPSATV